MITIQNKQTIATDTVSIVLCQSDLDSLFLTLKGVHELHLLSKELGIEIINTLTHVTKGTEIIFNNENILNKTSSNAYTFNIVTIKFLNDVLYVNHTVTNNSNCDFIAKIISCESTTVSKLNSCLKYISIALKDNKRIIICLK